MSDRPTPETDAEIGVGYMVEGRACYIDLVHPDFARRLERERDEARAEVDRYREEKDLSPMSWDT